MHERRRRAGLCRRRCRHGGAAAVAAGEVSRQRWLTGRELRAGSGAGRGLRAPGRGCTLCLRPVRAAEPAAAAAAAASALLQSAHGARRCSDKKSLVAAVGKAVFCGRFAFKSKSFPSPPASQQCRRVCRGTARPVSGSGRRLRSGGGAAAGARGRLTERDPRSLTCELQP